MEGKGGHQNKKHLRMEDDTSGSVTRSKQKISNITSEQENPMMNPVILKRLFELISQQEELNRARLVSKQWYKLSLPMWLKNGPAIVIPNFKDNDIFLKFLEEAHLNPSTAHEDIVGIKQYRKFYLENSDGLIYSRMHFKVFWNECGVYLNHLTIASFKFPDPVAYKDILFCRFTPNLEYLDVDVDSVAGPVEPRLLNYNNPGEHGNLKTLKIDFWKGDFPLDWKVLLNTFPNLKYFGVGNYLLEKDSDVNGIFTAINEISAEDNSRLDCYRCSGSYDMNLPSIPPSTRQAGLPLETFKYAVSKELPENVLANLLSAYAKSLKRFELYNHDPFDCYFGFPHHMNQLAALELTGVPVKDLTFLRKLPNIESLVLLLEKGIPRTKVSARTLFSTRLAEEAEEVVTVPSLTVFFCNYPMDCTADDVIGLRRLMSNLSHLGMVLDNTSFPLVCRHLTQLKYLHIYGDDGIIGILAEGDDQLSTFQPNISRLQNLKSFEMTWGSTLAPNFTQDSLIHGFANLPRLEKLVINVYKMTAHTELQQVMNEKLPFVEIRENPYFAFFVSEVKNTFSVCRMLNVV